MRSREEKKKCKGQESTIGKIIYSFLLFLPLLAIGVTCGYAMFNKNAYQSYSDYLTTESVQLADGESMYQGTVYTITYVKYGTNTNYTYHVLDNNTDLHKYLPSNLKNTIIGSFSIKHISGASILYIYNQNNDQVWLSSNNENNRWYDFNGTFYFQNATLNDTNTSYLSYDYLVFKLIATTNKLDNVFYYSIDKVQQSPLFNWAENSFVYTTTATTCTQLHITTPFIPLLISYWLIISVIYFLFDIALMLVWTIHKKIHELQESI